MGSAIFRDRGASITLNEAFERANMGAETEAAATAVAEARGLSLGPEGSLGPGWSGVVTQLVQLVQFV